MLRGSLRSESVRALFILPFVQKGNCHMFHVIRRPLISWLAFGLLVAHFTTALADETVVPVTKPPVTEPPIAADGDKEFVSLTAADVEYFETNVRPLLAKHCYECHLVEAGELKGGLSLHNRAGWAVGGESGPAIVPGKPDESLLIEAVRYESYEMPPKGKLSDGDISILEEWVRRGAPDPRSGEFKAPKPSQIDFEKERQFWAFQRPLKHHPPEVQNSAWPNDSIDFFTLSKLEAEGLVPAADADAATWLRRITFDLTGLPPTVEEHETFMADPTSDVINGDARQKVVDRLLVSEQFGVHWGRHWLDVARYADSNGGDFNATFYNAWRYRNYVVNSFNNDKPYDQFVREQLAGDLLPAASDDLRTEQLVGSTFLMLGVKMLSERDKNKLTMDVVDEQIDTAGKAFLGMTLGCARCHDHKFDPIPTADYYSLAGIFRSTVTLEGESQQYVSTWIETPLPVSDEVTQQIADHTETVKQMKADIAAGKKDLQLLEKKIQSGGTTNGVIVVDNDDAKLIGNWPTSSLSPVRVGAAYLRDDRVGKGEKSVTWTTSIPKAGKYEVRVSYPGKGGCDSRVPFTVRYAGGEERIFVDQSKPAPIDGLFCSLGTFDFNSDSAATVIVSNEGTTDHVLADAVQFIPPGHAIPVVGDPAATESLAMMQEKSRQLKESIKEQEASLKTAEKTGPKTPAVMAPRESPKIDDCEILVRGELAHPGKKMERGFLQVVNTGLSRVERKDQSGRVELADWITGANHPLTARVMVNRIWQHLLGEGIVRSIDNFGHLGETPSHQELLDTLSVEFVENGWSIKSLIRRIALSRTYGMSTTYNESSFLKDPDNRLLWHANRKRIPAESLRDSMLQISGELDLTAAESPVADLNALAIDNSNQNSSGRQTDAVKRSLYLPIVRNELPGFLVTFDFADPDIVTGRRPETNVPAQALYLMNSPFVKDRAAKISEELLGKSRASGETAVEPDDNAICVAAFRQILGRQPAENETTRMVGYVRELTTDQPESRSKAWIEAIQALLASTEFRMLE